MGRIKNNTFLARIIKLGTPVKHIILQGYRSRSNFDDARIVKFGTRVFNDKEKKPIVFLELNLSKFLLMPLLSTVYMDILQLKGDYVSHITLSYVTDAIENIHTLIFKTQFQYREMCFIKVGP